MSGMTSNERSEVKNLLEKKHKDRLAAITSDDPTWKDRVEQNKRRFALGRLRVEKDVVELKAVEAQVAALESRVRAINHRISAKLPKRKHRRDEGCPVPMDLCEAVNMIAEELNLTVMKKDPIGKKVLEAEADYFAAQAALAKCTTREDLAKAKIL